MSAVYWRDISARIEAERTLRTFADKLEQEVADRTYALSEAVEELRRSREHYSAVFENSPVDLVFMAVQPDGRIVCEDANPAWTRHSGYSRESVVGKSLDEILPAEQAEFATMQYRRAIETGQPVEYEYTARFPIGEVVRRSFLVPLPGDTGRIDHVLLNSVDLTEMRRVEAQLRQAQKMEAIGQLTGGIAHDFNNLLTAIVGNLDLLQSRLSDQRLLSHAEAAMRSALRGGQLTQQLLAYARRQNLSPRPVNVNAVIVGMDELLQRSLGGLVRVETELAADLWPATSDSTQLELVVLNLAINSRDAMPTVVADRHCAYRHEQCRMRPGQWSQSRQRSSRVIMFRIRSDRYRHWHAAGCHGARSSSHSFTTKAIGKGSGLGLAQVYGVASQFGGTVRLASETGVGTTVAVFLPRDQAMPDIATTPDPRATHATDVGGVVLVVDDNQDVREITAILLREAGYHVREAGSGPEALEKLASDMISLAVVDYAMPMMSGVEFVRAGPAASTGFCPCFM